MALVQPRLASKWTVFAWEVEACRVTPMEMKAPRNQLPAILAGHEAAQASSLPVSTNAAGDASLWVAHVDYKARCLHLGRYDGGSNAVGLPVRTIIADAMLLGSAGVSLAAITRAVTPLRAHPTVALAAP